MPHTYIYKTFQVGGTAEIVRRNIEQMLVSKGLQRVGDIHTGVEFRYPSVLFSSKRPLTCVSYLSVEVTPKNSDIEVRFGVDFRKIRYFTILFIVVIFGIIPVVIGYLKNGVPDIPPLAYLGIPLGFMIYYHVRWRVFNVLGRLTAQAGEKM